MFDYGRSGSSSFHKQGLVLKILVDLPLKNLATLQ